MAVQLNPGKVKYRFSEIRVLSFMYLMSPNCSEAGGKTYPLRGTWPPNFWNALYIDLGLRGIWHPYPRTLIQCAIPCRTKPPYCKVARSGK
jgi:hypothetical protein